MIQLRNGYRVIDSRLDRCRQVDLRTLNFPVTTKLSPEQYKEPRSYTWPLAEYLDQGDEGACVGFGFAHELLARPGIISGIDARYAREQIYWGAQRIDPWSGGSYPGAIPEYEGTSTLAGAQIVKHLGFIAEYRWAFELADLVAAVGYAGPAVIGIDWYENMLEPDSKGFIRPTGRLAGGHCICVIGIKIVRRSNGSIDPLASYFTLHNSWGPHWGRSGRCRLTLTDMAVLWGGGDFCIPFGRVTARV